MIRDKAQIFHDLRPLYLQLEPEYINACGFTEREARQMLSRTHEERISLVEELGHEPDYEEIWHGLLKPVALIE